MTESKDDMSKVSANIASNKIDDRAFYREAVEKGAFTVSAGGAKRIDIVKLLRIDAGRDRFERIIQDSK